MTIFSADVFQLPPQDQLARPRRTRDGSITAASWPKALDKAGTNDAQSAELERTVLVDSDVWEMIAAWDGTVDALQYHIESLISWGPFELLAISQPFIDSNSIRLVACRFQYFGPDAEKSNLLRSFHVAIARLTDWHSF
jgi:hypothetical protein